MEKILFDDVTIEFNEKQITQYNKLKELVERNISLFQTFFNHKTKLSLIKGDDNTHFIENIDDFFNKFISTIFLADGILIPMQNEDILSTLYIELLIRDMNAEGQTTIQSTNTISDELLIDLIAYKYFEQNNINSFIEFLKSKDDIPTIIEWLKSTERFNTYNYLLKSTLEFLKKNDKDTVKTLATLINPMTNNMLENIKNQSQNKEIKIISIDNDKIDELFLGFLNKVKAPQSWFDYYQYLKDNNLIEIVKDDNAESMCYFDDELQEYKIRIVSDGTINIFPTFVHEFIHYVSRVNEKASFALLEFPSIYFENIAVDYLIQLGYDKATVEQYHNKRKNNNSDIFSSLIGLFGDLLRFHFNGAIKREEIIELERKNIEIINETRMNLYNLLLENGETIDEKTKTHLTTKLNPDIEKCVDEDCDNTIKNYIAEGFLIVDGYQYLVGTVLTNVALEKDSSDIIPKMISITNNLSNLNVQDVTLLLGIKEILDSYNGKPKEKKLI